MSADKGAKKNKPPLLLIIAFVAIAAPVAWFLGHPSSPEQTPSFGPELRNPSAKPVNDYQADIAIPAATTAAVLPSHTPSGVGPSEDHADADTDSITRISQQVTQYRDSANQAEARLQQAAENITSLTEQLLLTQEKHSAATARIEALQKAGKQSRLTIANYKARLEALQRQKIEDADQAAFESRWTVVAITNGTAIVENTENQRRLRVSKGSHFGGATVSRIDPQSYTVITSSGAIH